MFKVVLFFYLSVNENTTDKERTHFIHYEHILYVEKKKVMIMILETKCGPKINYLQTKLMYFVVIIIIYLFFKFNI